MTSLQKIQMSTSIIDRIKTFNKYSIPFFHPLQKAVCEMDSARNPCLKHKQWILQGQTVSDFDRLIEFIVQSQLFLLFQYLDIAFQSSQIYCFNLLLNRSIRGGEAGGRI